MRHLLNSDLKIFNLPLTASSTFKINDVPCIERGKYLKVPSDYQVNPAVYTRCLPFFKPLITQTLPNPPLTASFLKLDVTPLIMFIDR